MTLGMCRRLSLRQPVSPSGGSPAVARSDARRGCLASPACRLAGAVVACVLASVAGASPASAGVPIHLYPANPHYVVFQGRPTVLISSGEHYGAVMNQAWTEADARTYLDTLRADGLNATRLFSGVYRERYDSTGLPPNVLAPLPGQFLAPWGRSNVPGYAANVPGYAGGNKFDLTRWDPEYFHRLKHFVAYAERRGVAVEYTFSARIRDDLWAISPLNGANNINGVGNIGAGQLHALDNDGLLAFQDALARKVATELNQFDNVYYEVINEPFGIGTPVPPSAYAPWQQHLTQTLKDTEAHLPRQHMIAWNISGAGRLSGSADNSLPIDPAVSILNIHTAAPSDVAHNYGLGRLVGDDEIDFEGPDDPTYRAEAWDFITAGGGEFNNLDFSFTASDPRGTQRPEVFNAGWVWDGGPVLRKQMGVLSRLVNSLPFTRMHPDSEAISSGPSVGTARTLAENGRVYLTYLNAVPVDYTRYFSAFRSGAPRPPALTAAAHTESITLRVPPGRYSLRWLDPSTGRITASDSVIAKHAGLTVTSPTFTQDAALLVTRGRGRR